jgi:hypothetical protein
MSVELELITPTEASRITTLTERRLEYLRGIKAGPTVYKFGQDIRYSKADVLAWIEAHRVEH